MAEQRVTVWVQRFKDRPNLVLQWIDPETGARKSRSAKTADEKAAEQARADLEYELNNGRYAEASRLSWERFRELFEAEHVSGTRPATQDNYGWALDSFERHCHPKTLRGITERTVSAWVKGMREAEINGRVGHAPTSVQNALRVLRKALGWAADQKMIAQCPKFPTIKVPKKRPRPVPAEAFEKLLAKAPDAQMRAYLLCGWLAGLRRAEAAALEWEPAEKAPYLDLAGGRIVLPAEFAKAAEDQWVPLDPVLRAALDALPREGRQVFHFVSRTGAPLTLGGIASRIADLAKRAGVRLTMHTLRKGFGCYYAGRVPAQVLQKLMRHANINLTMAFYANVDDAAEAAVQARQRNVSRNTGPERPEVEAEDSDVTPRADERSGGGRR